MGKLFSLIKPVATKFIIAMVQKQVENTITKIGQELNADIFGEKIKIADVPFSNNMKRELPNIEKLKNKGYEVLYFKDGVDEFVAKILLDYEGKKFKSVSEQDFSVDTEDEKKELESKEEENKQLLNDLTQILKDKVKQVKLTSNFKNYPVYNNISIFLHIYSTHHLQNILEIYLNLYSQYNLVEQSMCAQ